MWEDDAENGRRQPLSGHCESFKCERVASVWTYVVLKTATIPSITCGMPVFGSVTKHNTT